MIERKQVKFFSYWTAVSWKTPSLDSRWVFFPYRWGIRSIHDSDRKKSLRMLNLFFRCYSSIFCPKLELPGRCQWLFRALACLWIILLCSIFYKFRLVLTSMTVWLPSWPAYSNLTKLRKHACTEVFIISFGGKITFLNVLCFLSHTYCLLLPLGKNKIITTILSQNWSKL